MKVLENLVTGNINFVKLKKKILSFSWNWYWAWTIKEFINMLIISANYAKLAKRLTNW